MSSIFAKILKGVTAIRERLTALPEAAQVVPLHGYEGYTEANTDEFFISLDSDNPYSSMYAPRVLSGEYQNQADAKLIDLAKERSASQNEAWQVFRTHEDNIYGLDIRLLAQGRAVNKEAFSGYVPNAVAVAEFTVTFGGGGNTLTGPGGGEFLGMVGRVLMLYGITGPAGCEAYSGPYVIKPAGPPNNNCDVTQPVTGDPNFVLAGCTAKCVVLNAGSIFERWQYTDREFIWDSPAVPNAYGAIPVDSDGAGRMTVGPAANGSFFGYDAERLRATVIRAPLTASDGNWSAYDAILIDLASVGGFGSMYHNAKFIANDGANTAEIQVSVKRIGGGDKIIIDLQAFANTSSTPLDLTTIAWYGFMFDLVPGATSGFGFIADRIALLSKPGDVMVEVWDLGAVDPAGTFTKGVGNQVLIPDGFSPVDVDGADLGLYNYVTAIPVKNGLWTYPILLPYGVLSRFPTFTPPQGKINRNNYYGIRVRLDPDNSWPNMPSNPIDSEVWVMGHIDEFAGGALTTYSSGRFYKMDSGTAPVANEYDFGGGTFGQMFFRVYCATEAILKNINAIVMGDNNASIVGMVRILGREMEVAGPILPDRRRKEIVSFALLEPALGAIPTLGSIQPPRSQENGDELKHKPVEIPLGGVIVFDFGFLSMLQHTNRQTVVLVRSSTFSPVKETYR